MLLSEFIERTGVNPSAEEYARIEAEYYEFDGDKDAFCRAWVRSHPASVKAAKAKSAKQRKESRLFTLLVKLERSGKGTVTQILLWLIAS